MSDRENENDIDVDQDSSLQEDASSFDNNTNSNTNSSIASANPDDLIGFSGESDTNEEEPVETSFIQILRQLLQGSSGVLLRALNSSDGDSNDQIRLRIRNRNNDDDDDDDDDDDSDWSDDVDIRVRGRPYATRRRAEQIPKPPEKPDTSILDQSELKQHMAYQAGALHPCTYRTMKALSTTPGLLMMREAGLFTRQQHMSHGQCVTACSGYLPTSRNPQVLSRVRDRYFCGTYNLEGDLFMSACQDAKINIYDTTNGQWRKIKTIDCHDVGWSVLDTDFSHGGNHIIYSSWSQCVHLCNIKGNQEVHEALYLETTDGDRTGIFSVRFNQDDTEVLAGANNGYIYVYNREKRERTMKIDAHQDDISSVAFGDDSSHIMYSGGDDGVVKVWDRRNLREDNPLPVGELAGHYDSIVHIDSRNDARYLLTNSKDQSIKVWDIRRFSSQEGVTATKEAVSKQQWDYRWYPYRGKIVKKKLPGDTSLMTYYGHTVFRTLIRARFSPTFSTGQRYIYCGDGYGRVIIYDILTGKIAQELKRTDRKGHQCDEVIRDVSWHPYENAVISSGWDGRLVKWEHNSEGCNTQEQPIY